MIIEPLHGPSLKITVLAAIQKQRGCMEMRRGSQSRIHQVDQAPDRIEPCLVDGQRVVGQ
jgi:hypothetical protein